MAMIGRRDRVALAIAGAVAVAVPLALLLPAKPGRAPAPAPAMHPVAVTPAPPLAAAYERSLFASGPAESAAAPADAPALVGIVGRLGEDAVALVRTAEGTTRALHIGDSVDGWSLASLAIDAAFFTRGTERVRVPLPAG